MSLPARPGQGAAPASPALVVYPSILSVAVERGFIYSGGREVEKSGFISARVCFFPCAGQDGAVVPKPQAGAHLASPRGARPLGYPSSCQPREGIPALLTGPREWGRAFPLPKLQGCWARFSSYYPHLWRLLLLFPSAIASSKRVRCCRQLTNTSCHSSPPARPMAEGRTLLPNQLCSYPPAAWLGPSTR